MLSFLKKKSGVEVSITAALEALGLGTIRVAHEPKSSIPERLILERDVEDALVTQSTAKKPTLKLFAYEFVSGSSSGGGREIRLARTIVAFEVADPTSSLFTLEYVGVPSYTGGSMQANNDSVAAPRRVWPLTSRLPTGCTVVVGAGFSGKTPLTNMLCEEIIALEEPHVASLTWDELPHAIARLVDRGVKVIGIDSLRETMRMAGGPAMTGGYAAGAYAIVNALDRMGQELGVAIIVVVNPQDEKASTPAAIDALTATLATGCRGAIASLGRPVAEPKTKGKYRFTLKFGFRNVPGHERYPAPSPAGGGSPLDPASYSNPYPNISESSYPNSTEVVL